jgi:hypothetical protein
MQSNHITKICPHCGVDFTIPPNRARDNRGKFCGQLCRRAHKETGFLKNCLQCGVEFTSWPWQDRQKRNGTLFCGMKCYRASLPQRIHKTCLTCGVPMEVHPSIDRQSRGKYCSRICAGQSKYGTLEERFWAKFNKTESCWLWTGTPHSNGGGTIKESGTRKDLSPYRVSWEIHNGPIADGLVGAP